MCKYTRNIFHKKITIHSSLSYEMYTYQYGKGIWNDRRYDSSNIENTKKNESKVTKNIKTVLKDVPPLPALEIFGGPLSNLGKTITVKRLPKSPIIATVVKAKHRDGLKNQVILGAHSDTTIWWQISVKTNSVSLCSFSL